MRSLAISPNELHATLNLCGSFFGATPIVAVCANTPTVPTADAAPAQQTSTMQGTRGNDGVLGMPFARGPVFRCLDDYLAHLEALGALDLPWWREVSPGIYERVVRMTAAEREIATRAELIQRFGFQC
jgi:hypothetical protein